MIQKNYNKTDNFILSVKKCKILAEGTSLRPFFLASEIHKNSDTFQNLKSDTLKYAIWSNFTKNYIVTLQNHVSQFETHMLLRH